MRGCFVTATDTGVGKTVLAAALCAALRARGDAVAAFKPVVTGLDAPEPGVPADHTLLAACTGQAPDAVTPHTFGPPVSPHHAAALAGTALDPEALVAAAHVAEPPGGVLVCEGVGGLLVPLTRAFSIRDLAVALGLPLLIAARPGLGTINHTLLTLEAARAAGLDVLAVVLTPWPAAPTRAERASAAAITTLGGIDVHGLPPVPAPTPAALAQAGATLPLAEWFASSTEGEGS